jgi:MSHA biogenesis protein MshP|tara:strand:- start:16 stop:453 length:438 start_codon:yes stop_codon:yes gene_type:complete
MNRTDLTERGFTTIMSLFLLLVLTAMGGYMLTFSNTQQLTAAQDIAGSRAYWAARGGLEWGMGYVIRQPIATAACPASPTSLPGGATVFDGGFTVVLTCTMQPFTEGLPIAKNKKLFFFTSIASNGKLPGNVGFVERSLSGSVDK